MPVARFEVIKRHILNKVEKGIWQPGDPVPSENQLAEQFDVSRMTARRALSELTHSGVLERIQGAGTFVAEQLPTGSFLEIRNISEEVRERGHQHHAEVLVLESRIADEYIHKLLKIQIGQHYWYSRVRHFENGVPIQVEDRYVNAALVPEYGKQDFHRITPSAYLSDIKPLSEADHWIEAISATNELRELLDIPAYGACLKISRRTYSRKKASSNKGLDIVNFATLFHPGDRYRLGGHLNY